MSTPFHVLIISSPGADVVQVEKHLRIRWPALDLERVENVQGLQTCLANQNWDCVLFDLNNSSRNTALTALGIVRQAAPKLPFIIISYMQNFEDSIRLLKKGANDFIRRDKLEQLVLSIEKAIIDVEDTYLRSTASIVQGAGQAQWHALIDTLPDLVWL